MKQCDWMILGQKVTFRTCEGLCTEQSERPVVTEFGVQTPGCVRIIYFLSHCSIQLAREEENA